MIAEITCVKLGDLSHRLASEILAEIATVRALWPVQVAAA